MHWCLPQEIARVEGGDPAKIRGALLWDAFGGNKQGAMRALRQEWSQAMNVVIVGPDASALGGDGLEGTGVLVPGNRVV